MKRKCALLERLYKIEYQLKREYAKQKIDLGFKVNPQTELSTLVKLFKPSHINCL